MSVSVLLVDDNGGDIRLIKEGLQQWDSRPHVQLARTGHEALDKLKKAARCDGEALPDLTVIDLHLPGISGHEALSEIRNDPELAHLRVAVLTSSGYREHIAESERLGAVRHVVKPADVRSYFAAVRDLESLVPQPVGPNK